jgi:6-phosphogluconolactonase (cycloisomerase 2 family)
VANYFGQSASTFEYDPLTGKFGPPTNIGGILEFPGYTPKPGQIGVAGDDTTSQAASHPHMILPHPWLPVLYLPDLGEDLVHIYNIGENGTLTNLTRYQLPYGYGPRHGAISADGKTMYLLLELAAMIRTLSIDQTTGVLTQVGTE